MLTATTACQADHPTPAIALPSVIRTILDGRDAPSSDMFEVWVCSVPLETTDPLYASPSERVYMTAESVVERIADGVATYWAAISHNAYRPTFVAGGIVAISAADNHQRCIDDALAGSRPDAAAVLVVADAQHAADQPGGRSSPGSWLTCTDVCNAAATGRFVYVGANDFHPALPQPMPLDLIEHEVGHSLGLPHSGDDVGAVGNKSVGPYDVMADSAAPRAIDPVRRDAPDTLAIDRLDLGWLPWNDVHVARLSGEQPVDHDVLWPSTGTTGTRMVIVELDDHRVLTAELLPDAGYDDHLARAGVVVHLVNDSPEQCGATTRCTDLQRVQQIVTTADGGHGLLQAGETVTVDGTTISVDFIDDGPAGLTAAVTVLR